MQRRGGKRALYGVCGGLIVWVARGPAAPAAAPRPALYPARAPARSAQGHRDRPSALERHPLPLTSRRPLEHARCGNESLSSFRLSRTAIADTDPRRIHCPDGRRVHASAIRGSEVPYRLRCVVDLDTSGRRSSLVFAIRFEFWGVVRSWPRPPDPTWFIRLDCASDDRSRTQ